ncbi:MAG: glycosyl hydrolase 115 family protein [Mangrovibacterium sp.]
MKYNYIMKIINNNSVSLTPPPGEVERGLWVYIVALLLLLSACGVSETARTIDSVIDANYISFDAASSCFALAKQGENTVIYLDESEFSGVAKVAQWFANDVQKVSGADVQLTSSLESKTNIIVGTLGQNELINRLVKEGKLDVSAIAGQWEASLIQVIDNPTSSTDRALVIVGSDKRGTMFAMLDISRKIGVSPWYWWADVPVQKHEELHLAANKIVSPSPKVKYRGIFLNDEEPALGRWAVENYGGFNSDMYAYVFELLLRQKANFLWPAMWWSSFYEDDAQSAVLADELGIVISTSHHEPMMRPHADWKKSPRGAWNYTSSQAELDAFWREGIERMGSKESIITLAMRGDGDEAMEEGANVELLEKIVENQRKIIAEATGKPASETPQVWALYKEVQEYYDRGMTVPDDVTLLLCDDNWGNVRYLPALNAAPRQGGYGMYYHFDFVGGPRSYKWINVSQIPRIWEQMYLTYTYGVDRIWLVNVGDLKPMELPISFFLDLAWNPEAITADNLADYTPLWANQQFGEAHAEEIADILDLYTQYNRLRTPEMLDASVFNMNNRKEFEQVITAYNQLLTRAESVATQLSNEAQDAYFQLVLFPLKAMANLYNMYYAQAKNHELAAQGNILANKYAASVDSCFEADAQLTVQYHRMNNGKWNHMMAQPHIGYTSWNQPEKNIKPSTITLTVDEASAEKVLTPAELEESKELVSLEAIHFSDSYARGVEWKVVKRLGRTSGAMIAVPYSYTSESFENYLSYDFTLHQEPQNVEVDVHLYFSPTLNFKGGNGLKFGVSLDNGEVVEVNLHEGCKAFDWTYPDWWNNAVSNSVIKKTVRLNLKGTGNHSIRYWMKDPAIVLQKIEIER